jgi:hypothetical protein
MEGDKAHPMGRRQRESPPHKVSSDVEEMRVSAIKVFNMAKLSNGSGTRPRQKKKKTWDKGNKKDKFCLGRDQRKTGILIAE